MVNSGVFLYASSPLLSSCLLPKGETLVCFVFFSPSVSFQTLMFRFFSSVVFPFLLSPFEGETVAFPPFPFPSVSFQRGKLSHLSHQSHFLSSCLFPKGETLAILFFSLSLRILPKRKTLALVFLLNRFSSHPVSFQKGKLSRFFFLTLLLPPSKKLKLLRFFPPQSLFLSFCLLAKGKTLAARVYSFSFCLLPQRGNSRIFFSVIVFPLILSPSTRENSRVFFFSS